MPSLKVWKLIGNGFVGVLTLVIGSFGFYAIPASTMHHIMPYAGSMKIAMKALFYAPIVIPAIVVLGTLGCYYRFERRFQDAFLSLFFLMFLTSFVAVVFYEGAQQGFLDNHIVYQGNCQSFGVAVQVNGNSRNLYANFACDNNPGYVFKVWDPDVIAYVANHPGAQPLAYRLSAGYTLSPINTVAEVK
jgi:hypothetical protein